MRYRSVASTTAILPRRRSRWEFLVWARWRLPARERNALPVAVILNRLATAFLVLMPLGRLINNSKECVLYACNALKQEEIQKNLEILRHRRWRGQIPQLLHGVLNALIIRHFTLGNGLDVITGEDLWHGPPPMFYVTINEREIATPIVAA
jgi:hypothetical protein